ASSVLRVNNPEEVGARDEQRVVVPEHQVVPEVSVLIQEHLTLNKRVDQHNATDNWATYDDAVADNWATYDDAVADNWATYDDAVADNWATYDDAVTDDRA